METILHFFIKASFFLSDNKRCVFLDVDFSNDVPPPSVCIVVQAAGSIRPPKEYVLKGNGELFSYSPKSSSGKTFWRTPIHFRMMWLRNPLQSQSCPRRVFLTIVSSVYQAIFWTTRNFARGQTNIPPIFYSNYHFTDCEAHRASSLVKFGILPTSVDPFLAWNRQ